MCHHCSGHKGHNSESEANPLFRGLIFKHKKKGTTNKIDGKVENDKGSGRKSNKEEVSGH